jgi:hypothetical protein
MITAQRPTLSEWRYLVISYLLNTKPIWFLRVLNQWARLKSRSPRVQTYWLVVYLSFSDSCGLFELDFCLKYVFPLP